MSNSPFTTGVVAGRLENATYCDNFSDMHAPLDPHEALVAADRCYFCYDAPCIAACPTDIDIPLFIRQIQAGQAEGAAQTILEQNILGGMCARVCPTETLCEEACVREAAEGKPVDIGRLQRFATDTLMAQGLHPFSRADATGRRVAVVGAGPAGLACAHRLAMNGHDVVLYDANPKPGGLNEYGIASYKSVGDFAQAEVSWLLEIGGIETVWDKRLGEGAFTLEHLQSEFDAVFLGIGLSGVNALRAEGEDKDNVEDAVAFIARLRQARDVSELPIGRDVVVIGGGMTAVDAAVQAKLLGALNVTIVYRRSQDRMSASRYEQDHAVQNGVRIVTDAQPLQVTGNGTAQAVEFAYTSDGPNGLEPTGETFSLAADQVFKAIGQTLQNAPALEIAQGKISVSGAGRTSLTGVWAGGDCATGGDDLTVTAVAEGRDAAEDIHTTLMQGQGA